MGNSARMQNPDLWTKIDLSPTCDKVGCLGILVVTYNQGCLFRPFSAPWPLFFVGRSPVGPGPFQPRDCLIRLEVANKLWVRVTKTFQKGHKELPGSWRFFSPCRICAWNAQIGGFIVFSQVCGAFGQNSEEIWTKKPPKPTQKSVKSRRFWQKFCRKTCETTPPSKKRTTGTQTKIEHL